MSFETPTDHSGYRAVRNAIGTRLLELRYLRRLERLVRDAESAGVCLPCRIGEHGQEPDTRKRSQPEGSQQ